MRWVHKHMQPTPAPAFSGWPGFIPLQHDHYCTAHYALQTAFYSSISAFLLQSASKYCSMQPGHCLVTVPVLLCPGFEFGSKSLNDLSPTHCRRLHHWTTRGGVTGVCLGCFSGVVC